MKRTLMATTLGALLLANLPNAWADEYEQPVSYQQEWQGMGIGALVGAIAAGPPGLVVGAAGGALIGRHEGMESDLQEARNQIAQLEQRIAQSELRVLEQARQLRARQEPIRQPEPDDHQRRLAALIEGFVLNIQFRTGSADLEPRFLKQLEDAARLLKEWPELVILVDAFSDRRGTERSNEELTQRRAQVVTRRLQALGIEAGRIREASHGERHAEYPRTDAEGMDFDRRVLLRLAREAS